MAIEEIKNPEDLTKLLIAAGVYLLTNGLGEAEVTSGKVRVKVVVDLIEKKGGKEDE